MKNWYETTYVYATASICVMVHSCYKVFITYSSLYTYHTYLLQIVTGGDAIQVSGPPNSVQLCNTRIANFLHAFAMTIMEVSVSLAY